MSGGSHGTVASVWPGLSPDPHSVYQPGLLVEHPSLASSPDETIEKCEKTFNKKLVNIYSHTHL